MIPLARLQANWDELLTFLTSHDDEAEGDVTYWHSGGCWRLADAVVKVSGGKMVSMFSELGLEHVVVKHDDVGIDGLYGFRPWDALLKLWADTFQKDKRKKFVVDVFTARKADKQSTDPNNTAAVPWDNSLPKLILEFLKTQANPPQSPQSYAFADLPDDMQTLLDQIHEDAHGKFFPKNTAFPLVQINVPVLNLKDKSWDVAGQRYDRPYKHYVSVPLKKFPPAVVAREGADYWLIDGRHRLYAARAQRATTFPAIDVTATLGSSQGFMKVKLV